MYSCQSLEGVSVLVTHDCAVGPLIDVEAPEEVLDRFIVLLHVSEENSNVGKSAGTLD